MAEFRDTAPLNASSVKQDAVKWEAFIPNLSRDDWEESVLSTFVCPVFTPVDLSRIPENKHKKLRSKLEGTISYQSLSFVHSSLDLMPLFTRNEGKVSWDKNLRH